MEIMTIGALIVIGLIIHEILKGYRKDDERTTKMWQEFVKQVENAHPLYNYDNTMKQWIISHKNWNWKSLKHHIPDDIKTNFGFFMGSHPDL